MKYFVFAICIIVTIQGLGQTHNLSSGIIDSRRIEKIIEFKIEIDSNRIDTVKYEYLYNRFGLLIEKRTIFKSDSARTKFKYNKKGFLYDTIYNGPKFYSLHHSTLTGINDSIYCRYYEFSQLVNELYINRDKSIDSIIYEYGYFISKNDTINSFYNGIDYLNFIDSLEIYGYSFFEDKDNLYYHDVMFLESIIHKRNGNTISKIIYKYYFY